MFIPKDGKFILKIYNIRYKEGCLDYGENGSFLSEREGRIAGKNLKKVANA